MKFAIRMNEQAPLLLLIWQMSYSFPVHIGGFRGGETPPPPAEKIVVENGVIFQGSINRQTFRKLH